MTVRRLAKAIFDAARLKGRPIPVIRRGMKLEYNQKRDPYYNAYAEARKIIDQYPRLSRFLSMLGVV